MKKQLRLFLMSLLAIVGTMEAFGVTYKLEQVTSVEAGSLYVFEQDGYVMNNTVSNKALQTTNSYNTSGLTGKETYIWKLEKDNNNYYMLNVSVNDYLINSSSTTVSFKTRKTDSHSWHFSFQNETVVIQNPSNDRFLGYTDNTSHAYKAYAATNLNGNTYPHAIKVYKLVEEASAYTITPTSNNESWGTVSLSGNVITATPAEGYRISETNPYTISGSTTATVSQDGNTFTVTTTEDCTVQINFEAVPISTNLYIKSDSKPWVYTYNDQGDLSGGWHGTEVTDTIEDKGFTWYKIPVQSDDFYLVLNDGGSNQYPQSGGFHITGDTYLVYNSSADGTSSTYAKIVNFAEVSATNLQLNEGASGNSTITSPGLSFTYESSNTSVATVSTDGTVTAVGGGSCTITVSWATQEVSGTHYMRGSTTFNVTVTEAAKERTYVKVTSTSDIEDGKKYLIVYEEGSLAFDGGLSTLDAIDNYKPVAITDNTIVSSENIYFTIDHGTILSASGLYIGKEASGNGMDSGTSLLSNTISISSENAIITGSGGSVLRYNNASNQNRFRYYGSGQQAIQLYKEESVTEEVKIYVKADEAPHIYTWTGDGNSAIKYTGEWPGNQATETAVENGITWYTMTVPVKGFNMILDNGNSGENNQTANINNITEDTYFVWNSSSDGYAGANQYLKVDFAEVTANNLTLRVGNTGNSISKTPNGLELSCTSGDESVATIAADGTVTAVAEGTATMTVNWATQVVEGKGYVCGSTTFTVTVRPESGSDVFVKATSESELQDGMQIIIVNDSYDVTMGAQKDNNFGISSVTIDKTANPFEATFEDEHSATILTLEGATGAWSFKDEHNKYLYAASSTSNVLKTQETIDDNAKATITISGDNSDAAIVFQGTNTHNTIRYNNGNNGIFSCYASGQNPVQIYYRAAQTLIARPTITPVSGTYTEAQTVTITNNAEGATVYYTTDGTIPTASSTEYAEPFVLNQNGTYTIKAIAISSDGKSSVATNTITINIQIDAPTIDPADGSQIDETTDITISVASGNTIYYTTDGTDPVKNGELTGTAKSYSGPFNMAKAGTVKAVAMNSDGVFSQIVSATYTFNGTVTLPYNERFSAGLGNFITIGTGDLVWKFRKHTDPSFFERYGEYRQYAYCGNTGDDEGKLGIARFISPVIDLTTEGLSTAILSFIHAGAFFPSDEVLKTMCKVEIITNEGNKDITDQTVLSTPGNWTELTIPNDGWFTYSDNKFPRKNSGDIDLSEYIGNKVRICFVFHASDTNVKGIWNVDQISVRGEIVEKVDIAQPNGATGEGYTTYVTKNDIDVETTFNEKGVKLYKVIEFDANKVVIVQLGLGKGTDGESTYSEKLIPAETPVLVKGNFGENDLVIVNSQEKLYQPKGNLLRSAVDGVTPTANDRIFILQYPKAVGAYGFHLLGTGRELKGRRAYLNGVDEVEELTTVTNAKQGIFFFGEETDVEIVPDNIEATAHSQLATDHSIYDLQGRKVDGNSKLPKGIYITNGKKFVVK